MNPRTLILITAMAVLAGCQGSPEPTSTAFLKDPSLYTAPSDWAPENSALMFMSNRSGNAEIYRTDPGDTTWVNLTNNEASDNWPELSPDGSRIAFHSDRNGRYDVFIMDADGSNQQQLTTHDDHDYVPSWMPDGRIVFTSWRQEPEDSVRAQHVYTMNADGSDQQRLALAGGAPVTGARFAPDGRTIVFGREVERGIADLYLASLDDLEGRKITASDAYYGDPSFSPNGQWISYYADHNGSSDLLVQDVATAAVDTALAGGNSWYARWSPDSRWMLSCTETSHANLDILYFPVDGSAAPHPLIASRRRDCEGRWVPALTPPTAP